MIAVTAGPLVLSVIIVHGSKAHWIRQKITFQSFYVLILVLKKMFWLSTLILTFKTFMDHNKKKKST